MSYTPIFVIEHSCRGIQTDDGREVDSLVDPEISIYGLQYVRIDQY